jgi:hypothetical protein
MTLNDYEQNNRFCEAKSDTAEGKFRQIHNYSEVEDFNTPLSKIIRTTLKG